MGLGLNAFFKHRVNGFVNDFPQNQRYSLEYDGEGPVSDGFEYQSGELLGLKIKGPDFFHS